MTRDQTCPDPDYALAPGVPALQVAPSEIRRLLLAAVVAAAAVAGSLGFLLGRADASGPAPAEPPVEAR